MNLKEQRKNTANSEFNVINTAHAISVNEAARADEEMEIDLVELGLVLLDKLRYIVFFCLLGALLFNACAFFLIKPSYESTATMYIVSASDDSVVDLTDLNIGTSLTSDYEELMYSYPVLEQVIEKLDLDMTFKELAKMIVIENPADTRILKVTATSNDPELSRDIANTLVGVSVDYLPKTMGTEQPNIAQEARAALKKSSPSYIKFTLIGALLGMLLCCAYITVRHLMDDTIHTAEDMEKYFGIVPLATIPDMESLEEDKDKSRVKSRMKNKKSSFRRK